MPDIRQSLDQLRDEWSTCQRCPLGEQRLASQGKFVFGEGSTGGIMFIGEGPGRNEETQGRPFVGRSGEVLRGILNKYQFRHWYISNVVACRSCEQQRDAAGLPVFYERRGVKLPRIIDVTPPPQSISACLPRLYEEIYRVDPVVIVSLGVPAAEALLRKTVRITKDAGNAQHITIPGSAWVPELTDKKGAWTRKVHGQWVSPIQQNEVRYLMIPTLHPAYVLRKLVDHDSRSPLQELARHIGLAIKTYERYMLEVFGMIPEAPAADVGEDWIEEYRAELTEEEG